jgi:ribonuclease HII
VAATVPPLREALKRKVPTLSLEHELWEAGAGVVVGMDEVGRGAWAGPLTVGAAVLPADRRVYKVRDSKMLTEGEREQLFERVAGWCRAWAVGHASPGECDDLGMSEAQRLAARRALEGLGLRVDAVLLDGTWDFVGGGRCVAGGDGSCLSIAAASILAKVTRDRLMRGEAEYYPAYWFESNKGYPGPRHRAALQWLGPSAIHRRSWVFMDSLVWPGLARFERPGFQRTLFPGRVGQARVKGAEG